ncbi:IS66 family transposase zinc-finger binding domain-containing protein [Bradyrhizobium sp. SZCCHNG3015]|uniref:IS66 family transposase zinc-finger binding domain-containing protein n=1 Tax=Bradyrhizobium sp. SZCCHNG3015 TaxID=3057270 RepID=UPI00396560ED
MLLRISGFEYRCCEQFGCSSERIDPNQLALGLEDLDSDIGRVEEAQPKVTPDAKCPPRRRALPSLPREDVLLDVQDRICGCCGGALHLIGESVSEMLDWVPAQLRIMRTMRPKYALPSLQHRGASWRAGTIDRRWPGDAHAARARIDQKILRSPSALSAVADLRP